MTCPTRPVQRQKQAHDPGASKDASIADIGLELPLASSFKLGQMQMLSCRRCGCFCFCFCSWPDLVFPFGTRSVPRQRPKASTNRSRWRHCSPAQQLQLQHKQEARVESRRTHRSTTQVKKQHSFSSPFSGCTLRGGPKYRTTWGRFELSNERCISSSGFGRAPNRPYDCTWPGAACTIHGLHSSTTLLIVYRTTMLAACVRVYCTLQRTSSDDPGEPSEEPLNGHHKVCSHNGNIISRAPEMLIPKYQKRERTNEHFFFKVSSDELP